MYSNINTFEELCESGCKFILNKIKTHPFLIINQNQDNLYELVGEYAWIRDYLYQYNKMGFYTVMSQPGLSRNVDIYPTYLDYKNSFANKQIIKRNGKFGVSQRAEVEGFMKMSQALKLYESLKNEPRIKIGLSNLSENNSYEHDIKSIDKYATLSYEIIQSNNETRFMEMEAEFNETVRNNLEGVCRDVKLSNLYHVIKRYYVVRTYSLKSHIPNLIDSDIVGVSIMDLEWKSNDFIWEKIYLSLLEINKN